MIFHLRFIAVVNATIEHLNLRVRIHTLGPKAAVIDFVTHHRLEKTLLSGNCKRDVMCLCVFVCVCVRVRVLMCVCVCVFVCVW